MSPSPPGVNVCVCMHHRSVCLSVMLGVGVAGGEDVCHCVCGGPASEPPSARPPPRLRGSFPTSGPAPLLPPNRSVQAGGAGASAPPPLPIHTSSVCVSHSVMSNSVSPWTVAHQASLSMEFSRQEFFLQGIFLIQGSNPGLPHCRQILYSLSYLGAPTSPTKVM